MIPPYLLNRFLAVEGRAEFLADLSGDDSNWTVAKKYDLQAFQIQFMRVNFAELYKWHVRPDLKYIEGGVRKVLLLRRAV